MDYLVTAGVYASTFLALALACVLTGIGLHTGAVGMLMDDNLWHKVLWGLLMVVSFVPIGLLFGLIDLYDRMGLF